MIQYTCRLAIVYCASSRCITESTNEVVNVEFDLLSSSVHCIFNKQTPTGTDKSCSMDYGPGEMCTNLSLSSRSQSTTSNLVNIDYHLLPPPQSESVYCYVLTAFDGTFSASIEGTFSTGTANYKIKLHPHS